MKKGGVQYILSASPAMELWTLNQIEQGFLEVVFKLYVLFIQAAFFGNRQLA